MKVGIPKEIHPGECRAAATPDTAKRLQKLGFEVLIESGAGATADFSDTLYEEAGCKVVPDAAALWSESDIVAKVRGPEEHPETKQHEVDLMREGGTLISFVYPAQNEALLEKLKAKKATVLGMEQVPRISRAQKLDALSSMANISGYRSVVEAANNFGRFFTGQITAAGKVPPAKVLVIGAGVAGLAAIGAAKGLGAMVRSFDTRPEVKEQVESMGAEFLLLDFEEEGGSGGEGGYAKVMSKEFIEAEMALFHAQAKEVDIIITTALIPGKKAPTLITEDMVKSMKDGSVVVDLAAEQGGNCECTEPGKVVQKHGVTCVGYLDLPSRMASVSSQLYGTNICHLLDDMGGAENYKVDFEDEVVRGTTVVKEGEITWPPPKLPPPEAPKEAVAAAMPEKPAVKKPKTWLWLVIAGLGLLGMGMTGDPVLLQQFTVFVLACVVGWLVIWNVTPALHTPLMSVTNAISGIIVVGGMLLIAPEHGTVAVWLSVIAILVATINIVGGFLVTQRMLKMFRK